VVPVTFKISCAIWWCVFSSQILFSVSNPSFLGLVTVIISPLSATCKCHRVAYLYTSYLFAYSVFDREMLHLMGPLCLRMPSYNYLLDDLDGQFKTRRNSPSGALTLMHPVVRAKSSLRCVERADFHCSLSPLYLRDWISRLMSLCKYSQHDLSVSGFGTVLAVRDGCHFAFVSFALEEGWAGVFLDGSVGASAAVSICGVVYVGFVKFFSALCITFWV
jgi:hypothetical protein